jgi:hypothetical protein
MPTRPSHILSLLQTKAAEFRNFDEQSLEILQRYRLALKRFESGLGAESAIVEALDRSRAGVIASGLVWRNREESLGWVRDRLTGVATFAVDGSQIYPTKDISIPIALVQIGWFENHHLPQGSYEKDIRLDLLTPNDLKNARGEVGEQRVNLRRFQMETQRLIEYMEEHKGDRTCLVFLDGSLVATFAEAFDRETLEFYVECLVRLLRTSEDCRVPLVGYVDTSTAQDLTQVLRRGFGLPEMASLYDAQILGTGMPWGDRTPLLRCQRDVLRREYGSQGDRLGYLYLKTHEGVPARLELPLWIYEDGRLDEVLDWVRGEVIIGAGYPYAIETADQVAVLQADDRQAFFRIVQDWAEQEGLNLRLSRKMVSKARRR